MKREDMKNINRLLREIGNAEVEGRLLEMYESLGLGRRPVLGDQVGGALPAANGPRYGLQRSQS